MSRCWPLLIVVVVLLTGGVRQDRSTSKDSSGYKLVYIGCIHFGTATGDGVLGSNRFGKMVDEWNADSDINAVVLGGDFWTNGAPSNDSLYYHLNRINADVFPVVGNHEWAAADTGSGNLYDSFIAKIRGGGGFFEPYTDTDRRGKRWYFTRLHKNGVPTNVVLLALNNVRDVTSGSRHYFVNNPKDGSGIDDDDFDGIADSTSAQRVEMKEWVQQFVEPDDVVFVAQHRATLNFAESSGIRPAQEDIRTDANLSQIVWLEDNLARPFVVLEQDTHENKGMYRLQDHYTFSASMIVRPGIRDSLSTWSSYLMWGSYQDTAFSNLANSVLVDSMGTDGDNVDHEGDGHGGSGRLGWNMYLEFTVRGLEVDVENYLVQNDYDTARTDSTRILLGGPSY